MEKISYFALLLISIPEAMLVGLLGLSLLGFKPTLKQILLFGLIEGSIGAFARLLPLPFGIHTIVQFFTFSLVIYLVVLNSYKISLLAVLLGISIYGSVEAVIASLMLKIMNVSLSLVWKSVWIQLAFFLPEAIIIILIIILMRHFNVQLADYRNLIFKSETKKSYQMSKSFSLICLFLTQNFIIALFYIANYIGINDPFITKTLTSVSGPAIVIIIVLPVVAIFMIRRLVGLIQNEVETKTQLDALRHVEELLYTIRAQRHNFSHDLQVAYGLLEVEAFQEAKEYIRGSMAEIASTSELVKTDNLGLTALLHTKTGLAEAKKVKLHIQVETSLKKMSLEARDINVILGNLIDNAIEAVQQLPVEQRIVDVILSQDFKNYLFEIRNYRSPITTELIENIYDPGFSTKGPQRGMGLYSVKTLLRKYNGRIQAASDSYCTCFKVWLPQQ